jgi:Flp pilus assembly protein TadG
MRWVNDEDGAMAVTIAVSLIVLIGVGAFVLDVGNLSWERRQLQVGADAAALAAAQDLASGEPMSVAEATARVYAAENNTRGAHVEGVSQPTSNSVRVETVTGDTGGPGVLGALLAGVIGTPDYFSRAQATATWGATSRAATIPITFSYCEWEALVGDVDNPTLPTGQTTIQWLSPGGADCKGPAGHYAPGGWGWLDSTTCTANIELGVVPGRVSQGNPSGFDSACTPAFFQGLIGQTVLIPVFTDVSGTGANASYTIAGFAAVEIQGYRLHAGNPAWASNPPCGNPNTCLRANFVDWVRLGDEGDYGGGPNFGTSIIALTG